MLKGIGKGLFRFVGSVLTLTLNADGYISLAGKRIYVLTTAITANSTVTTAPSGSFAVTTHATGKDSIFRSDGSKWQYPVIA